MDYSENDLKMTIKFNDDDPDQLDVALFLKKLGRKKSKYISQAIKYYIEHDSSENENKPGLTASDVEKLVDNLISKKLAAIADGALTQIQPTPSPKTVVNKAVVKEAPVKNKPEPPKPVEQPKKENTPVVIPEISDDEMDDILEGLDVFGI